MKIKASEKLPIPIKSASKFSFELLKCFSLIILVRIRFRLFGSCKKLSRVDELSLPEAFAGEFKVFPPERITLARRKGNVNYVLNTTTKN